MIWFCQSCVICTQRNLGAAEIGFTYVLYHWTNIWNLYNYTTGENNGAGRALVDWYILSGMITELTATQTVVSCCWRKFIYCVHANPEWDRALGTMSGSGYLKAPKFHYNSQPPLYFGTLHLLYMFYLSIIWKQTSIIALSHWARDKMAAILQTTFSNAFSWKNENVTISIKISLKFVSNWQYSIIGSDNGLAPARRQAIIWTNDDYFTDAYMRHSASMIKTLLRVVLKRVIIMIFNHISTVWFWIYRFTKTFENNLIKINISY